MDHCASPDCNRPIKAIGFCKWHLRMRLNLEEELESWSISTLSNALKEVYSTYWVNPKDEIKYHLINKYSSKLAHRKKEAEALLKKALEDGKNSSWMKTLVYSKNPFLQMMHGGSNGS